MGADVDIVLAKLDALRERFDDERETNADRHSENVTRLERIEHEVKRTNGRVTTLEEKQRTLGDEFQAVRKRWHDFRESIQDKLRSTRERSGENRHLTMRDVYLFSGGFAMFYALAKLMNWIP